MRYINASNVCVLLGEKYNYKWATEEKILEILKGSFQKYSKDIIVSDININTMKIIEKMNHSDLKKILNAFDDELIDFDRLFDLTVVDLKKILNYWELKKTGSKSDLIERIIKYNLVECLNSKKKEIICQKNHKDYKNKFDRLINKLPDKFKKIIDNDLTMGRGQIEEDKIITQCKFNKTNDIHYINFTAFNEDYKIGCRFDCDEQVEIKNRKYAA